MVAIRRFSLAAVCFVKECPTTLEESSACLLGGNAMRLILTVALSTLMLSASASAQTRVITAHAETASALKCLLDHGQNGCRQGFAGSARPAATYWRLVDSRKGLQAWRSGVVGVCRNRGSECLHHEIRGRKNGRRIRREVSALQKVTFTSCPPVRTARYILCFRGGEPDDEKLYSWAADGKRHAISLGLF